MADAKITLTAEDRTRAAFESVKSNLTGLHTKATEVAGVMAGLGVTTWVVGMAAGIKQAVNEWDELGKAAQRAGMQSAQSMAEFQFAAKLAGLEAGGLEQAVGKLAGKMADAASGNKDAAAAFQVLGIKVRDASGQLRATEDVLTDLAQKFSMFKDSPEKTALALDLFGKSGKQLIPLLNGGAEGIEKLREEFRQLRGTLDDRTIKAAEQFNDNLTRLEASAGALKRAIASELLPGLVSITDAMVEQAQRGNTLLTVWAGIAQFANVVTGSGANGGVGFFDTKELAAKAQSLKKLNDEVARLDALKKKPGGGGELVDAQLAVAKQALESGKAQYRTAYAEYSARRNGAPVKPELSTGDFTRMDRSRELATAPVVPKPSGDSTSESAYARVNKSIADRLALTTKELEVGRELTEFEKFEVKVLEDLKNSKVKVTESQVAEVKAKLDDLKAADLQRQVQESERAQTKEIAEERQRIRNEEYKAGEALVLQEAALASERLKAGKDMLEQIEFETKLLSMNTEQREVAIAMRELEAKGIKEGTTAWDTYGEAIKAAAANRARMQQEADHFKDVWSSIDRTAHDVWVNIFDGGTNVFKRLGQTLKATVLDMLYQMTVRRWVINIVASATGTPASAAMQAAGGGNGLGSIGNLGGLGNTGGMLDMFSSASMGSVASGGGWMGSLGSSLGLGNAGTVGGSFASTAGGGLATDAMGATVAEGAAAANLGSAGLGAASSAIPYVGALFAASQGNYGQAAGMAIGTAIMPGIGTIIGAVLGSLIDGMGSKGGPKADGRYGKTNSVAIYDSDTSAQANKGAEAAAKALQGRYETLSTAYGGDKGVQYGLGFSTDPSGDSPSFLEITGSRGGAMSFGNTDLKVGRSEEELQAAIAEMSGRALLQGLQQSNLTGIIGDYLRSLGDAASLASDKIAEAVARIEKAASEKASLDETWYQLTATAQEKLERTRKRELEALDISNRAMAVRIYALQDEIAAQERAKAVYADVSNELAQFKVNLSGYVDRLNATPAGLLQPEVQLANARAQFDTQLSLARGGNRNALQGITGYADQLIAAQTNYTASGTATQDTIGYVKQVLQQLPAQLSAEEFVAKTVQDGAILINASLQDLIARADANSAAQVAAIAAEAQGQNVIQAAQTAATQVKAQQAAVDEWAFFGSKTWTAAEYSKAILSGRTIPGGVTVKATGSDYWSDSGDAGDGEDGSAGAFADGGHHPGGWRWVGERGPELEYTAPSRIYSHEDSMRIVQGASGAGNPQLLAEMRGMREEISTLRVLFASYAPRALQQGEQIANGVSGNADLKLLAKVS